MNNVHVVYFLVLQIRRHVATEAVRLFFPLRVDLEVVVDVLDGLEQCFSLHMAQIVLGPPERADNLLLVRSRLLELLLELLEELLRVRRHLFCVLRFNYLSDLLCVLLWNGLEGAQVSAMLFFCPARVILTLDARTARCGNRRLGHAQVLRVLLLDRVQSLYHGLLRSEDFFQVAQNRGKHAAIVLLLWDGGYRLRVVEFVRVEVVHGALSGNNQRIPTYVNTKQNIPHPGSQINRLYLDK